MLSKDPAVRMLWYREDAALNVLKRWIEKYWFPVKYLAYPVTFVIRIIPIKLFLQQIAEILSYDMKGIQTTL